MNKYYRRRWKDRMSGQHQQRRRSRSKQRLYFHLMASDQVKEVLGVLFICCMYGTLTCERHVNRPRVLAFNPRALSIARGCLLLTHCIRTIPIQYGASQRRKSILLLILLFLSLLCLVVLLRMIHIARRSNTYLLLLFLTSYYPRQTPMKVF